MGTSHGPFCWGLVGIRPEPPVHTLSRRHGLEEVLTISSNNTQESASQKCRFYDKRMIVMPMASCWGTD